MFPNLIVIQFFAAISLKLFTYRHDILGEMTNFFPTSFSQMVCKNGKYF